MKVCVSVCVCVCVYVCVCLKGEGLRAALCDSGGDGSMLKHGAQSVEHIQVCLKNV